MGRLKSGTVSEQWTVNLPRTELTCVCILVSNRDLLQELASSAAVWKVAITNQKIVAVFSRNNEVVLEVSIPLERDEESSLLTIITTLCIVVGPSFLDHRVKPSTASRLRRRGLAYVLE